MITMGCYLGLGHIELALVWRQLWTIFQASWTRLRTRRFADRFHENVWPQGQETAFLYNVPVTATTSDKHGRRRQSSQAARGQGKSLRTFFCFVYVVFLFFFTDPRRLPCPSAVLRVQHDWNEASFSIFFLHVLLLCSLRRLALSVV